jgi:hypothetical protein
VEAVQNNLADTPGSLEIEGYAVLDFDEGIGF